MTAWHWYFVIAAYAIGILGTLGVTAWSWLAMARAEARRDAIRKGGRNGQGNLQ